MIAQVDEGVEIHEAGLLIRPFRAVDADAVLRACQDPDIQRWTTIPRPYLREHADAFVTEITKHGWSTATAAPLGVFDAATGELVGSNGLAMLNQELRTAEIGYWVAPWARGRGVATRATRAVARWCLDILGIERLAWRAEVGNHASRLVAERVGFQLEGVLRNGAWRADGTLVDCWAASLLPGRLREADAPVDPLASRHAATFGRPQPTLTATTPGGAPISLRPLAERDLESIVLACRDPESVRWTTVPHPYGIDDARFFVGVHGPGCWARGDAGIFAVVDADDRFAGSMDLRLTARSTGDVGYLIAPWARGRGYASTALRTICEWGFATLGLHRIEWRAYLGNEPSRRTAERAGFTVEGVARAGIVQRGEYRDAWVGSLLASDP